MSQNKTEPFYPHLSALLDELRTFPNETRQRGTESYKEDTVREAYFNSTDYNRTPKDITATVKEETIFVARWLLENRGGKSVWTHRCTCGTAYCHHLYAVGIATYASVEINHVTKSQQDAVREHLKENILDLCSGVPLSHDIARERIPEPPKIEALVTLLIAHHHRDPAPHELAILRTLVGLWRNRYDVLYDYQLRELNITGADGKALYSYSDPVSMPWVASIASPLKYWQHLAFLVQKRRYILPAFLIPLTDHDAARAEIADAEHANRIDRWKKIFQAQPDSPDGTDAASDAVVFPHAIRIRFHEEKPVWETCAAPDTPWAIVRPVQCKQWFAAFSSGTLALDPTTPVFALFSKITTLYSEERARHGYASERHTLRIQDLRTRHLLRWLLLSPSLHSLFVTAAGTPFKQPPVPLKWVANAPRAKGDITFKLVTPDGTEVAPARCTFLDHPASNPPTLAVCGDNVYACPPPLPAEEARREFIGDAYTHAVAIPAEVLSAPDAIRYIHRNKIDATALGLPLLRVVPLRPACHVRTQANENGTEYAIIELSAHTDDNSVTRTLRDGKWKTLRKTDGTDDTGLVEYDTAAARTAEKHLASLTNEWNFTTNAYTLRLTRAKLDDFAAWLTQATALGIDLQLSPELAHLARPADTATLQVEFTAPADGDGTGIDWFDLKIALKPADTDLSSEELQLLLRANGKFVNIPGKGWRRLQVALDATGRETLQSLGIEPDTLGTTPEHHRFHTLQLADERIAGLLPAEHANRIRERAAALHAITQPPIPPTLNATLRPYQTEGFHFLAHLAENNLGGVLADDMGLGKTVQALTWLLWLKGSKNEELRSKNGKSDGTDAASLRVLVVCPKSVVPNWQIETARFTPALTTATLDLDATDPAAIVPDGTDIIVVNYAQLRNNAATLAARHWDAVILDEGQNIKNPASQTAKAARDLPARHRLVLTGTPIENRTLDLWSLFAFAMPGFLGTQAAFKRLYNDKNAPLARSRLAARVRHFMLRRTKSQVATDLPPRIEEDLYVELDGTQRKLYDAEVKRARLALLNIKTAHQFDLARFNILQSLLRLRQICCHPALIGFANAADGTDATDAGNGTDGTDAPDGTDDKTTAAKLDALLDQLEPILEAGNRVLIFSQFVSMLELIRRELRSRRIRFLLLTGKTENRQSLVDEFQSDAGPPVFLLSLKAAGSGLNLTAASYVFLFDPWWNPAVEAQAIDRTHRIGQKSQVIAYRLLAKNTVEEKIRQLQQQKAALANAVVQEESLSTVLNLEDIRFVLS